MNSIRPGLRDQAALDAWRDRVANLADPCDLLNPELDLPEAIAALLLESGHIRHTGTAYDDFHMRFIVDGHVKGLLIKTQHDVAFVARYVLGISLEGDEAAVVFAELRGRTYVAAVEENAHNRPH